MRAIISNKVISFIVISYLGGGAIGEQRHPTASGIACSSVLYGDSRSSLPTGKQAIEYGQEIPQTNPRHREEETHNTNSHKQQ